MLTLATGTKGVSKRISPSLSVTLRPEVVKGLMEEAQRTNRSLSSLLNQLAEEGLKRRRIRRQTALSATTVIRANREGIADFRQVLAGSGNSLNDLRAAVASLPRQMVLPP